MSVLLSLRLPSEGLEWADGNLVRFSRGPKSCTWTGRTSGNSKVWFGFLLYKEDRGKLE